MGSNNQKSIQESQRSTRHDTIPGLDSIEEGPFKDLLIQFFADIIFKFQELKKSTKVLKKSGSSSRSSKPLQARVTRIEFNKIKELHGNGIPKELHGTDISSALSKFINFHENNPTWSPDKLSRNGKGYRTISCNISVDEVKKIENWCKILGNDWNMSKLIRALLCSDIPNKSRERVMREFVEKNPSIFEKHIDPAQKKMGDG